MFRGYCYIRRFISVNKHSPRLGTLKFFVTFFFFIFVPCICLPYVYLFAKPAFKISGSKTIKAKKAREKIFPAYTVRMHPIFPLFNGDEITSLSLFRGSRFCT